MALSLKRRAQLKRMASRKQDTHLLRVVVMGRPNVGKSTLFNRLVGTRRAIVHNEPGVTRDRVEKLADWYRHGVRIPVRVIDTGGMGGDRFAAEIQDQVEMALNEADVGIFVLDGTTGVTALDRELLTGLRKKGVFERIPIIAVVNKVDSELHETFVHSFHSLKIEPLLTVSAEHGRGIDDLKLETLSEAERAGTWELKQTSSESSEEEDLDDDPDEVFEDDGEESLDDEFQDESDNESGDEADEESEEDGEAAHQDTLPRIAIVGRPNVGKSTLVNALLGKQRMITSPIAGTTIDAVDSVVELDGKPFVLVDTAGIRRKSRTEEGVEVLSVVQAKKALERADIAVLVLDASQGVLDQDEKIGGLIEEAGCSVILILNKWDTQKKNLEFTREEASTRVRGKMRFLKYAPLVFTSGLERKGLSGLGELATEILHQKSLKVPTNEFSKFVRKESLIHNPRNAKFYLCHQTGRNPPTFVCHVSDPEKVHFSLKRHILNAMRERWGFMGSPVRLHFLASKSDRKALKKDDRKKIRKAAHRRVRA